MWEKWFDITSTSSRGQYGPILKVIWKESIKPNQIEMAGINSNQLETMCLAEPVIETQLL